MRYLLRGLIFGFIIVLPGMSGGTLLLIFGMYEKLLSDISRFKIVPYLPFILAAAVGIVLSGIAFTFLFEEHRDLTTAFLMGSVLASVRPVLGPRPKISGKLLLIGILGLVIGLVLAAEPIGWLGQSSEPGIIKLLLAGAFGSVTMLIPGVPGSSVLIIMGVYDNVLRYLATMDLVRLMVFLCGSVLGVFMLAQAVDKFYKRYKITIAWAFSGLIVGGVRALIPGALTPWVFIALVAGFSLVWGWDVYRTRHEIPA